MTGISQTNPRSILIFKKMTKGHQSKSMPDTFSVIVCRLDFGFPINFNVRVMRPIIALKAGPIFH